jgi:hypothetical protein
MEENTNLEMTQWGGHLLSSLPGLPRVLRAHEEDIVARKLGMYVTLLAQAIQISFETGLKHALRCEATAVCAMGDCFDSKVLPIKYPVIPCPVGMRDRDTQKVSIIAGGEVVETFMPRQYSGDDALELFLVSLMVLTP